MNTPRKFDPRTTAAIAAAAAGALSPAAAQLDALARAGGKVRPATPEETAALDARLQDDPPGPDHWTRDDIEAALGCLEYIAASLEAVMDAAVKAGTIPASAAPPKG